LEIGLSEAKLPSRQCSGGSSVKDTNSPPRGKRRLWKEKGIAIVAILSAATAAWLWIGFVTETRTNPLTGGQESDPSRPTVLTCAFPPSFLDELALVEHQFPIVNRSDRTIHILDLKTSCSCAGATIADRELRPGQQTQLSMKVDQRGRRETFAAECLVVPDTGEAITCRIVSPIFPRTEFEPASVQLGVVDPGAEVDRRVVLVTRSRSEPNPDATRRLVIQSSLEEKPIGRAILCEAERKSEELPGGIVAQRTPVRIHLTLPRTGGQGSCELALDGAVSKGSGESRCRMDWYVESLYVAAPNRIFFGSIKAKQAPAECLVRVRRKDGTAFRIMDLECRNDAVALSCATKGRIEKEHEVEVRVKPGGSPGFLYDQVVVTIDDPKVPRLSIPIAAAK
jgi:hypothetical protein